MAREEVTPSAGWTSAEGGGYGVSPVSTDQGSREEETNRINIDDRYMRPGTCLSNAINYMPAMRLAQERAVVLTEKQWPRSGGGAGPGTAAYFGYRGEGTEQRGKGGRHPPSDEANGALETRGQGEWSYKSAMRWTHGLLAFDFIRFLSVLGTESRQIGRRGGPAIRA